jgi:hypothetical protein
MDLTGATFFAQVRKKRTITSDLIATLTVTIEDAANGEIEIGLAEEVVRDIAPGTYVYDLLVRIGASPTDNLWSAPFIVEQGVSQWPTA